MGLRALISFQGKRGLMLEALIIIIIKEHLGKQSLSAMCKNSTELRSTEQLSIFFVQFERSATPTIENTATTNS